MRATLEKLARYGRLLKRHYALLLKSWVSLVIIRCILSARGYQPVLAHIKGVRPRNTSPIPLPILAWSVRNTARAVPGASCLTQALAVRYLAAREGAECIIRIGVKQRPEEPFEAHAWVLAGDDVLIGGQIERIEDFTPIVDL